LKIRIFSTSFHIFSPVFGPFSILFPRQNHPTTAALKPGFFVEGRPHGHGRMKWPEGSVYDGNWQRGELHGQATMARGWSRHSL
jgi:hypothetical protein